MANQPTVLHAPTCLAILVMLFLCPLCFAQSVTVRVVDTTGQPISDQVVTAHFLFANPANDRAFNQRTDANGEALLQLPQPTPEAMDVEVGLVQTNLHCSCRVLAKTERVMREGLTIAGRTRGVKSSKPIPPTPGHIIFVARPPSLLEKVLFDY
jgi:hypothetical protein